MALEHRFITIFDYVLSELSSDDICNFLRGCEENTVSKICVEDSFLQTILFDKNGKIRNNLRFNEWGITIIKEEQANWILFLESVDENKLPNKNVLTKLLDFFCCAYRLNMPIVHFGI